MIKIQVEYKTSEFQKKFSLSPALEKDRFLARFTTEKPFRKKKAHKIKVVSKVHVKKNCNRIKIRKRQRRKVLDAKSKVLPPACI